MAPWHARHPAEEKPPSRPRRRKHWLAALLLGVTALLSAALYANAQTVGEPVAYLPWMTVPSIRYLPAVAFIPTATRTPTATPPPTGTPINIIANPSFEDEDWYTDPATRNQEPSGWAFYAPQAGQLLPFPTKRQGGQDVPAVSGGQGEYVHKYAWQLPPDEHLGAPRGLILNGQLVYKVFSDHIAHALQLSQTLSYTPGQWVNVTGYILGETQPAQCSGSGVLEDDHFVASVRLGSAADTRFYNFMVTQFDVPGNQRAWNRFSVMAQMPASGQLPLVVVMQSNWGCPVDFFIDHFRAYRVVP